MPQVLLLALVTQMLQSNSAVSERDVLPRQPSRNLTGSLSGLGVLEAPVY